VPDFDFVSSILKIILYDLILSGDNAVVIGMAARRLPMASRRRAVIIGGVGAVGLRVLFTAIAALVLDPDRGLPVIGLVGGALLLWIAYRLVRPQDHGAHVSEADSLAQAIKTIVLADVVMSLDNILAVGAEAKGNLWLLICRHDAGSLPDPRLHRRHRPGAYLGRDDAGG
jgi:YjbE family integral membrane protein